MQDVTSRRRDSIRLELLVGILGLAAEERRPEEIVGEAARMLASAVGDVNVTFVAIEPGPTLHARYSTEHNGPIPDTLAIPGYIERLETRPDRRRRRDRAKTGSPVSRTSSTGTESALPSTSRSAATGTSSASSGSTHRGRATGTPTR